METILPTPMTARVYLNLPEGKPLLTNLAECGPLPLWFRGSKRHEVLLSTSIELPLGLC